MLRFSMTVRVLLLDNNFVDSDAGADLIPYTEFAQKYEDSHFSEVFFWAFIVSLSCPFQVSG